ncbi:PREDICTED: CICLE_v10013220mg [Prunus dulcis]|uniref:PREDICTED: CICLE_v10013220mg n=1 Tax=Prunus dulcis TaxID=3755 RepID=A0A5E4FMU4_PRUDU|nr:PREDICTED: CICLE_v10013220mg [Prunus dulcis]
MGGNNRQKTPSSSSFFSLFKSRRPRRGGDELAISALVVEESYKSVGKVWHSVEDRGRWVAEPGIDDKAAAFIDRIHKKIASESDVQPQLSVNPTGNA